MAEILQGNRCNSIHRLQVGHASQEALPLHPTKGELFGEVYFRRRVGKPCLDPLEQMIESIHRARTDSPR
ncbi:MAG: hypothetical protein RI968_793 [Pseudomonadota bacterium]